MMHGVGCGMIYAALAKVVLLTGLAYVVWVLSNKEGGALKLLGRLLAAAIIIIALASLLHGTVYSDKMGRGGSCGMKDPEMMKMMHEKME